MKETGVTIMQMDAEMDHGPIISQEKLSIDPWPMKGRELDRLLAEEGARLLATVVPLWLEGGIEAREQQHDLATFCAFIEKDDALIDLSADARQNLLKIAAYDGWPIAHFFAERNGTRIRVQILDAHLEGSRLVLDRVKPEGRGEMSYPEFERGMG
jgi:methionyl-tRNA formyltransferase